MKKVAVENLDGTNEEYDLITVLRLKDENKRFTLITKNEVIQEGIKKVYISEVLNNGRYELIGITDDNLWEKVKNLMKEKIQGTGDMQVETVEGTLLLKGARKTGLNDDYIKGLDDQKEEAVVETPAVETTTVEAPAVEEVATPEVVAPVSPAVEPVPAPVFNENPTPVVNEVVTPEVNVVSAPSNDNVVAFPEAPAQVENAVPSLEATNMYDNVVDLQSSIQNEAPQMVVPERNIFDTETVNEVPVAAPEVAKMEIPTTNIFDNLNPLENNAPQMPVVDKDEDRVMVSSFEEAREATVAPVEDITSHVITNNEQVPFNPFPEFNNETVAVNNEVANTNNIISFDKAKTLAELNELRNTLTATQERINELENEIRKVA